jgi:phytoene/squalene synthetase
LAADITKAASRQTYYTIRFLVDRDRAADAFRAYGYYRWVDDVIDEESASVGERIAFVNRQKSLLDSCYRGRVPPGLSAQEWMLADLVRSDREKHSGLQIYLRNMMDVMAFDAERRGRIVTQAQLSDYTHKLAKAVTEAIHHFIGGGPSPRGEASHLAVAAAHITHMLRDALEDVENGYFNVPREYLEARGISPRAVASPAYREWVRARVRLARACFAAGWEITARAKNWRCRLAGYAYTARFEWMLRALERDRFRLRPEYPERKGLAAGLWMGRRILAFMILSSMKKAETVGLAAQPVRIDKR